MGLEQRDRVRRSYGRNNWKQEDDDAYDRQTVQDHQEASVQAYNAVKTDQGAAGVDRETIGQFEADLKGNLYKLWNRMSSGSYFPPPVRAVSIPKKSGGERILGVPTVADRVAQTVVKQLIEPDLDP